MADLLDIAPSTSVGTVAIGEHEITVHRLSSDAIAYIISRFPEVAQMGGTGDNFNFMVRLFAGFIGATGAIIAAGCGHLGEEKYEKAAKALSLEEQMDVVLAIMDLTFPNGIAAYFESLTNLANRVTGSGAAAKQVVKVRSKHSPSTSHTSSDVDSHPAMQ
jgi:hypothetical protein